MSYIKNLDDWIKLFDDFNEVGVDMIIDWNNLMDCYRCIRNEGISSKELETHILNCNFKESKKSVNDIIKWYKFKKINKKQ